MAAASNSTKKERKKERKDLNTAEEALSQHLTLDAKVSAFRRRPGLSTRPTDRPSAAFRLRRLAVFNLFLFSLKTKKNTKIK